MIGRFAPAYLMSAFYAIAFFVNGVLTPFFPVLLQVKGLSGEQIAFVLATPQVMRMFTMPVVSGLSDRAHDRRQVMAGLIGLTLGFSMLFGFAHGDLAVMAVGSILLVLSYCVGPLADAFAMIMDRHGLGEYGKMRLWGSASFILGNIVGGYAMEHSGSTAVYLLVLFGFAIAMLSTVAIPPAPPATARSSAAALTVLRKPAFLAVLLGHAVNQAGHAALYSFGTILWRANGFSDFTIGIFWAVGVIAEIILFSQAGRMFRVVSPLKLMAGGAVIGCLRWLLFSMDLPLLPTLVLQVMHAGSFALAHIGLMRFLREVVPTERAASAQGTFVIFNGLAMALGTALAGRLVPTLGSNIYVVMSIFPILGLIILMAAGGGARRLPAHDASFTVTGTENLIPAASPDAPAR